MKQPLLVASLLLALLPLQVSAASDSTPPKLSGFYGGLTLAYGKTTWENLASDDLVVEVSAPIYAIDHGPTYGAFLGYTFNRNFALEAAYLKYPSTYVKLYKNGFYYPIDHFTAHQSVYTVNGKFLVPIRDTRYTPFAEVGLSISHRHDIMARIIRFTPDFGLGLRINIKPRLFSQVGFNLVMGYGASERRPVDHYVPFLYTIYYQLAYRF